MRTIRRAASKRGCAVTNTSRDGGKEALSPAFVVILRFTNLALFSFTGNEPRDVGLPELMLLERLGANGRSSVDEVVREVATVTGVDLDRLMPIRVGPA